MSRHNLWRSRREKRGRLLERLFALHEGRCAHCGKECIRNTSHILHHNSATVDHVTPRCELPTEEWFNDAHCVLSCGECNQARAREMVRTKLEMAA